ncbi:PD-(D/E)XK motif protein [Solibacillus sp. NPDC093137]|uniref:PD-(D/E)XK motif protein n=1 Tax=Solibacillus sp. NPDC093137 TaxID=3390678 RepID=UPI003D03C399
MINNPWENIHAGSRRRAIVDDDIFFVKDAEGLYGVLLEFPLGNADAKNAFKLHNIEVRKNYIEDANKLQWHLILLNKDQWQIFYVLCQDLIYSASLSQDVDRKFLIIESRLKHWQELLKKQSKHALAPELQMGLFAELMFLKEEMSKNTSITEAVQSWYGPEKDKQDFITDKSSFEIKSYRTSNGEKVYISSKEQLDSHKDHAYLIAYGLTRINDRCNICTIAKEIEEMLKNENEFNLIDLFYIKLLNAGYSPILYAEEDLINYKVDRITYYEVTEDFPCIKSDGVMPQIISISYQIDLAQCSEWGRNHFDLIFKEGTPCIH